METDDGERRSTWREYLDNVAAWKSVSISTMWNYLVRRRERRQEDSCGQLLKSLQWRDRCHNESEVKIDNESEGLALATSGSVTQRSGEDTTTVWLLSRERDNHGTTITEKSRCGDDATRAECGALLVGRCGKTHGGKKVVV